MYTYSQDVDVEKMKTEGVYVDKLKVQVVFVGEL